MRIHGNRNVTELGKGSNRGYEEPLERIRCPTVLSMDW